MPKALLRLDNVRIRRFTREARDDGACDFEIEAELLGAAVAGFEVQSISILATGGTSEMLTEAEMIEHIIAALSASLSARRETEPADTPPANP